MKRAALAATVALGAAFAAPSAHAQIVTICPTCTQEVTQVAQWAHQLQSMASELQTVESQLQSSLSTVSNLTNLGSNLNLSGGNLNGLIGRLTSGTMSVQQLQSLGPTLQSDTQAMGTQLTNLRNLLQQVQSTSQSDQGALSSLRGASAATIGTHGAVQVGNQLQGQIAQELLNSQQIENGIAQTLASQVANETDRQNAADSFHQQADRTSASSVSYNDGQELN